MYAVKHDMHLESRCMITCPSMNLRQVSVIEKMKIENALFCIISISDLGRSGGIFEFLHFAKNNTHWTFLKK